MIHKGIPFKFYVLCTLFGTGTAFAIYGFLTRMSLIFGFHTTSKVIILMALLLSLVPGGILSGKLADKLKNPLFLYIGLSFSVSLIIFLESFLFSQLNHFYVSLQNQNKSGLFETGILRFLCTFLYMLIPFSLIGGILPALIRSFIRHISYSGRYMSSSILSLSVGAIMGILLMGLFLIPFSGYHMVFIGAALCFFISGAFALFQKGFKVSGEIYRALDKPGKVLRFKKKKPILEAGKKLTKAMLYGYSFQAFTFSAMLIISFRILKQYSTLDSNIFNAMVIIIVLCGFLAGTSLYRTIAEKPVNKYMTLATFQIVTGICALICYSLLMLFSGIVTADVSDNPSQSVWIRHILLFSLFLFLPSLIHGLSFPLAGKLYPKRMQYIGRSFGKLYSLLYMSLLSGIILAPFLLIPLLGLHISYFFLSLIMLFSGMYLIFRDSRLIRGYRLTYASIGLALFLIITMMLRKIDLKNQDQRSEIKAQGSSVSVEVVANKDNSKSVYINGHYAFGTDDHSIREQILSASIPLFINPDINTALVTGFGTGLTPAVLDQQDISEINIAEMYAEIIRISSDVFADENNDIMTGSNVFIYPEDPRSFLSRSDKKFDLITSGLEQISFTWLFSQDFYNICHQKLTKKGILCQTLPTQGMSLHSFFSICKTASETFSYISLWYLSPDHVMLMCSPSDIKLDLCQLEPSITRLNRSKLFADLNMNSGEQVAAHLIASRDAMKQIMINTEINTDNKPNLRVMDNYPDNRSDILSILKSISGGYIPSLNTGTDCNMDIQKSREQILKFNQSLFQQVSLSFVDRFLPPVDFFEATKSPFQKYL